MTEPTSNPRDEYAERAVIGQCLALATVPGDVAALIAPGDVFTPSLRTVAEACWDLTTKGAPCDPIAIRTELLRRGERGQAVDGPWLVDLMHDGMPGAAFHARQVRDLAVRRQVIVEATRAVQSATNPGSDPYEVAASLYAQSLVLAERNEPERPVAVEDVHAFADGPTEFDWLVPGLLERGDRLLVTGGEGSGKSVLTRQTAVCIAAGVHPFTGVRMDPQQVLLVDLENGTRHLRRAVRKLLDHAEKIGRPVPSRGLYIESRPAGIDLTGPEDEAWLNRLCATVQPALLVIGPLYRMHATDMAKEEPARHMTRALDAIRSRFGCSLIIETHAGHGAAGQARDLRPVGSSLFRRWPEFGYGLRPKGDDGSVMKLVAWRGARDEREWPAELRRGGPEEWPWAPFQPYAQWMAS